MARIGFLPYTPNSKIRCPKCGKAKRASRFQNLDTLEIYPHEFSVCDRVQSCGWNNPPGKDSLGSDIKIVIPPKKPTDFLNIKELQLRMSNNGNNHFFKWVEGLLGMDALEHLKEMYGIATSLRHPGFVSFPQIDPLGRLRRIKEMRYSPITGKRSKANGSQRWAFELAENPNLTLEQIYFGSHLLKDNDKDIKIVESEKTALICYHFMPQYVWLATGSLTMLSDSRCSHIRGRNVELIPDLGEYDNWKKRAAYIKGMASLKVSNYLEVNANKYNINIGEDLADVLIKTK